MGLGIRCYKAGHQGHDVVEEPADLLSHLHHPRSHSALLFLKQLLQEGNMPLLKEKLGLVPLPLSSARPESLSHSSSTQRPACLAALYSPGFTASHGSACRGCWLTMAVSLQPHCGWWFSAACNCWSCRLRTEQLFVRVCNISERECMVPRGWAPSGLSSGVVHRQAPRDHTTHGKVGSRVLPQVAAS